MRVDAVEVKKRRDASPKHAPGEIPKHLIETRKNEAINAELKKSWEEERIRKNKSIDTTDQEL
jgi:hypothetical protein